MKQWVILGFFGVQWCYNILIVYLWWIDRYYLDQDFGFEACFYLYNMKAGIPEAVVWHLTLLMSPWVMWQLFKVLWPRANGYAASPPNP